ncbi:tetratricopeptide repeat protein [Rhabdochromatium marinum]|uniref:O-linked N-acetylglucosamine transferase, SPINDLY family protein n=1 Tax=Rhabdochromatium marinum TaxID=48729 RepID=UPI0019068421|nr:glycosyltransferase family 41 protein [Rhabdochromatium marinum]
MLQSALRDQQKGDLAAAVAAYDQVLELKPDFAEVHNNRGNALSGLGRLGDALASFDVALRFAPTDPITHFNRGNMLRALARPVQALEAYAAALNLNAEFAEAHLNLGLTLKELGRLEDALTSLDAALRLKPGLAAAHNNRGIVLKEMGRLDEALAAYDAALSLRPDFAKAHNNRGFVLNDLGRLNDALAACDAALRIQPDLAEAHNTRGCVLNGLRRLTEALAACDAALRIQPDLAEAHNTRGCVLNDLGRLTEALAACDAALRIQPELMEAHNMRGFVLERIGQIDEAVAAYAVAMNLKPNDARVHSNRIMALLYCEQTTNEAILSVARQFGAQFDQPALGDCHPNPRQPERRLRIGYVSGDFRRHAVADFLEALLAQHDRSRIEVLAYTTNGLEDAVTARIRGLVDRWQSIVGLSDERAAQCIRSDGVDVLIDLSGHTAGNRLGAFAQRAAPVQAHYLGFAGSTGLAAMDYWIGDEWLTPDELAPQYSETLWRLPRTWVAYRGVEKAPEPAWRASGDGTLWLGSFNTLRKMTPRTIILWSRVLQTLPEAKLLLKTHELADESNRKRVLTAFAQQGIASDRIELQGRQATSSWPEHMAYYNRLDIALDPVGPVGGGTTTCDALWMGVPVVTKLGDRVGSRMSAAMLSALGREEWIARDDEDYIAKVVMLARAVAGRRAMRLNQRERMRQSPLCDAQGLARALEDAYEAMFERCWTKQNKHDAPTVMP